MATENTTDTASIGSMVPALRPQPPAVFDEIKLGVTPVGAEGRYGAILFVDDEPIFRLGLKDTPEEACDLMRKCLGLAITDLLEDVAHDLMDEGDDEELATEYTWIAAWADQITEGQIVRLPGPHGTMADVGQITRVDIDRENDVIFAIWVHPNEEDCGGHHFYSPPRGPIWLGTPIPADPGEITE